jgi:AbrB family looped-hinge helix DNA binding protein
MTKQFKLTVKGQVTIPKDVRDALGLKPGEPVAFERDGDRVVVRKGDTPPAKETASLTEFKQRLERARARYRPLPLGMTTDEYMALIREPVPIPDAA